MWVRIRPFVEGDYEPLTAIANLCYPDYLRSVEEIRHWDSTWDSSRYERVRLVAVDADGTPLGVGQINHQPSYFHPRKYRIDVQVHPERRRRGIGSALFAALLRELEQRNALVARTDTKGTMADSLAFVERRGFVEVFRAWESRLPAADFDFARFAGADERVAEQGIEIVTLAAERARDPEAVRRAYEVHSACFADVPSPDPFTKPPFERFLATNIEAPNALLDGFFLARAGDRYVGVCNLHRSELEPGVIYQGLTGVRREFRGRGIALALKLATVRYARAQGKREIRTWNDTRNRPMLRNNEAMGFVKQPVWIEYEKPMAKEAIVAP